MEKSLPGILKISLQVICNEIMANYCAYDTGCDSFAKKDKYEGLLCIYSVQDYFQGQETTYQFKNVLEGYLDISLIFFPKLLTIVLRPYKCKKLY